MKLLGILLIFFSFCIVYSCSTSDEQETEGIESNMMPRDHAFVGGESCQSCHEAEWDDWQQSHHDYAMAEATEEMVRGDFDDATFRDDEDNYRFFRQDEKFMVEAPGPEGELEIYEVVYTFGWEPLQQYLVDFGKGKYQALHAAWDTEQKRWFSLYPDDVIKPEEWMHWTSQSMNWNTMCADCHSTNLRQNYIAEADSFNTTWDVINVSCEACHGPGAKHVEFMNTEEAPTASDERIREDLILARNVSQLEEINTCAPCHSRREKLADGYIHGDPFLDYYDPSIPHPPEYFADGEIRDEVYVYGSFLQSKMYALGIKCTDCHDPHTLRLKESIANNKLCMTCHEPAYNTPEHHFHEQNTVASQCINCHMTGQIYMGNDYRRDHSFEVPRPDLSEKFQTPNACNDCHDSESAGWAADAVEEWYGPERDESYKEVVLTKAEAGQATAEELENWISGADQPEIIKATLAWHTGQFSTPATEGILKKAMKSEEPLIRSSALKAIENLPPDQRRNILIEAITDSSRSVRLQVVRELSGLAINDIPRTYRQPFIKAKEEYERYLDINQYFPQGQMSRGQFYEKQGEIEKAIEAYQKSLEKDPGFEPARLNLAYLYNRVGNNLEAEDLFKTVIEREPDYGQAYYSLGLLLAEQNRLDEAINYFEQAGGLMPEFSRLYYNWAVALQTQKKYSEAELIYKEAIKREQENSEYIYGIITLYMQQEQYKEANKFAKNLKRLNPNNPDVDRLLQIVERELN